MVVVVIIWAECGMGADGEDIGRVEGMTMEEEGAVADANGDAGLRAVVEV